MSSLSPRRRLLAMKFRRWFLRDEGHPQDGEGDHEGFEGPGAHHVHHQHPWHKVMCLTGVDYFSTLGYQPGIAFLAAGALSPIATLVLVLLTLFGALPIYNRVAAASPHGEGSISMLERLLTRWKGKLFVLMLLGFVATDFIITITLSAADATAHVVENPFAPHWLDHPVAVTLVLIAFLGAVFLKGFKEAIGIAVVLVWGYLGLNVIVLGAGLIELFSHPVALADWWGRLRIEHGNPMMMIAAALLVFPKLALGLSGFETGVAVMPLVKGEKGDTAASPVGRIKNTRKLLRTVALIMSVLLIASSIVTSTLIPPSAFAPGGEANGRAIAFLAHSRLGEVFGTIYDVVTILILWFAGASAMAGLLNIVPRYLPRYGMAPNWAGATRPLVVVFTLIAFLVTVIFQADVDAQGGAYATGVLVLMYSAALAVTIASWKKRESKRWAFSAITFVFLYTTVTNVIERPEGIQIASIFIVSIVSISFISRALRSTELRVDNVHIDTVAQGIIDELSTEDIRIIANRRDRGDEAEYRFKEQEKREDNHIPDEDDVVFLEVLPGDASDFSGSLQVTGHRVGYYRVLRTVSPVVPNAIAAFLLFLRDQTGRIPHVYFGWSEGNPFMYMLRYIFLGEGDTAPVTREVLRQAEEHPERRPSVHVGG